MLSLRITNLIKFLVGILLVQGVTVVLVLTAQRTHLEQTALLLLLLSLGIGVLTALWFAAIADASGQRALARANEHFSRQREKLRVRAEQDKTRQLRETQRQVQREQRRARTGSKLKTGLMIGGVLGLGGVMLLTQFMTLGLLTLATAGGTALGYGLRARQERLRLGGRPPLAEAKALQDIPAPEIRASRQTPGESLPKPEASTEARPGLPSTGEGG